MSVLEAMAQGCPVVATRVADVPHIIEDGLTGLLLVPPGDPVALARTLRCVLSDLVLRRKVSDGAKQHVIDRHSASRMVCQTIRFLKLVVGD